MADRRIPWPFARQHVVQHARLHTRFHGQGLVHIQEETDLCDDFLIKSRATGIHARDGDGVCNVSHLTAPFFDHLPASTHYRLSCMFAEEVYVSSIEGGLALPFHSGCPKGAMSPRESIPVFLLTARRFEILSAIT